MRRIGDQRHTRLHVVNRVTLAQWETRSAARRPPPRPGGARYAAEGLRKRRIVHGQELVGARLVDRPDDGAQAIPATGQGQQGQGAVGRKRCQAVCRCGCSKAPW
jgi:hypothetical protein